MTNLGGVKARGLYSISRKPMVILAVMEIGIESALDFFMGQTTMAENNPLYLASFPCKILTWDNM